MLSWTETDELNGLILMRNFGNTFLKVGIKTEDLLLEVEGRMLILEMEQLLQIADVLKVPQKDIVDKA